MYLWKWFLFCKDGDKSAKKKAAAASLGGQQEMTPEQLQAEEEVFLVFMAITVLDISC